MEAATSSRTAPGRHRFDDPSHRVRRLFIGGDLHVRGPGGAPAPRHAVPPVGESIKIAGARGVDEQALEGGFLRIGGEDGPARWIQLFARNDVHEMYFAAG